MAAAADHVYRLRLGRAVVEMTSPEPGFCPFLADYFGRASDPAPGAVSVEIILQRDPVPCPVPNSLLMTKSVDGGAFDIDHGLVRGTWDAAAGRGSVTVRSTLLRGQMMRVFEQLVYQMFHSAAHRLGYRAALVHAAGIARGGDGYLFVGPSGAGKSTVAGLSAHHRVLNDEMNLVELEGPRAVLVGTPFNAFFDGKVEGSAPLTAVLLLEQASAHALLPANPAQAAADLAAQVAPPVGLGDPVPLGTRAAMLELALAILERTPVHVLRFAKDAGFWNVVPRT
ncbi:MAG TPA: hypothetical protein PLQ13_08385 [Candidatus Krumholzibacteria bacterium]|nr:hypothetical protein [Candidatus Krumholzibacteria bacterium]